jgi:hypothetical protein
LKRPYTLACLIACSVLLVTCGGKEDAEPTAVPTATVAALLPPGAVTVGELLDQVATAWPSVTSLRTTSWSTDAATAATPPASGQVTIDEAVLPSSRQVTKVTNGQVTDQQRAIDGRVYMKGSLVVAAVAPMVGPDTWVEVDPAAANSSSPIASQVSYLLSPITSPFATSLAETRGLQAAPAGSAVIEGRTCALYTFGSTSGIRYELAIDGDHLPCRLVESASGYANVTIYAYNVPDLSIAVPDVATPTAP